MYEAFGMDPTEYDFRVFRITSEIATQVFPFSLDLDNAAFRSGLERLRRVAAAAAAARARGGMLGALKRAALAAAAAVTFARLYLLPVKNYELPTRIRASPAW
jgi:magnesium-protoporphyrin IX monomethyl ester (oxidative) cyclase